MTTDTPIIEKIRALLRKAESTDQEGEAKVFMAKAMELMAKYNIKKVDTAIQDASSGPIKIDRSDYRTGHQRYETDDYISVILRSVYRVQVLWSFEYEHAKTGRLKKRVIYVLIGAAEDREIAAMVAEELHKVMRHFFRLYLKRTGLRFNSISQHSFLRGFREEYIAQNRTEEKKALEETSAENRDRYALVLVDNTKAVQLWIDVNMEVEKSRNKGQTRKGWDPDAYREGAERGASHKAGLQKLGEGQ